MEVAATTTAVLHKAMTCEDIEKLLPRLPHQHSTFPPFPEMYLFVTDVGYIGVYVLEINPAPFEKLVQGESYGDTWELYGEMIGNSRSKQFPPGRRVGMRFRTNVADVPAGEPVGSVWRMAAG